MRVVYSPISQLVQRTVQFTPWYWNSLFHGLIFLGRMQRTIHAAEAIHTISIFRSTRYPLLLGGQRQCRFKSCPRILYMTSVPGIEPQTSRSQVQHLTTRTIPFLYYSIVNRHILKLLLVQSHFCTIV